MKIYVKKVQTSQGDTKESLWIRFTHQGKLYRKPLGLENTKGNMRLAQNEILPTMQLKLINGDFFNKQAPTINEYALTSFELNHSNRKQSTQNDYKIAYEKHIKPYFGNKKINALKPSDIAMWQNQVLETVSPRRLKMVRAVLSTIIQDALRDEIITRNPLPLVKLPRSEKVDISPFSLDEIFKILNTATAQYKNFFALGFFSGMRSGEMVGLKWSDIDFKRKEISIKRAIKMGVISTPKTVGSTRTIDIIDSLLPYLEEQYKITGQFNSYVFLNEQKEHFYDIKRIRNTHWEKVLKMCNLEYRPIYHTRHTFATIMLENGEDILWVSNMLGHANSTMTLTRYARYIKRDGKRRATFLENEVNTKKHQNDTDILKSGLDG